MKRSFSIILFLILKINLLYAGGGDILVRLREHFEMKRLTNHHGKGFDSIEITAYLTHLNPGVYFDIPDTVHYLVSINGRVLEFSNKHKIIIDEPGFLRCGYFDKFTPYVEEKYNFYVKDHCFFYSNTSAPDQWIWSANIYYLKPNYKPITDYTWNQIEVSLKYSGLEPKPEGNYCFGNELKRGINDDAHYHIDHVNWYNNGNLLNHQDSLFTIVEPGNYYAEIVSNFGYKYYSDTIKISNYQFAKYTDCIDAQIEVNNEIKKTNGKGFGNLVEEKLKIFPNPVTDKIEINFKTCNKVDAYFELFTLSGISLFQKSFQFMQEENSMISLDFNNISPGLYFLCFDFNGLKRMTRIIKQ